MSEGKFRVILIRSKRRPLHDSGYRNMQVSGIANGMNREEEVETIIAHRADNIIMRGEIHLDTEPDGTVRLFADVPITCVTRYEYGSNVVLSA